MEAIKREVIMRHLTRVQARTRGDQASHLRFSHHSVLAWDGPADELAALHAALHRQPTQP